VAIKFSHRANEFGHRVDCGFALFATNSFKHTDTVLLIAFIGFGAKSVIAINLGYSVKKRKIKHG
jgi:hypothetical protein